MRIPRHDVVMETPQVVRCSCGSEFSSREDHEAHQMNVAVALSKIATQSWERAG